MELPELEAITLYYSKKEKLFLFFIFCLTLFAIEIFFVYEVLTFKINWIAYFFLHGMLCVASLALLGAFAALQYDIRLTFLFSILLTFLGPFGASMSLLITSIYFLETKFMVGDQSLLEILYPDIPISKSTHIYNRITYGWKMSK